MLYFMGQATPFPRSHPPSTPPHCCAGKYGDKCAFAHSKSELRRLSLEEMQQAGRIPNANKVHI